LYYCSGTSLSSCAEVDAAPGYYMVGSETGSAKSYIACTSDAGCMEEEFEFYGSCGSMFFFIYINFNNILKKY